MLKAKKRVPVPSGGRLYPLSPLQRGMLYDALFAPGAGVDIEQMIVELPEVLHVPAFVEAWQRVVERHDVLRTAFRWKDTDTPLQEVHARVDLPVEQVDWRDLPGSDREAGLEAFLRADRARGFDLSVAPLTRLALFRLAEAEYRLVWTFHHALLDGRAMTLVLRELFTLYEGLREGRDLVLPPPPPYAEYIAWLARQDFAPARAFWSETLKGFTAPTTLPRRMAGVAAEEEPYAEREVVFPEETAAALRELARVHGLTLNTLVQGAWAVLLSRYAGEDDVVFGTVRACRHSSVEGADSMVGLFINTVPVRVRPRGEAPVLEVLREIRAQGLAVRPHEHAPLAEIRAWSEVPRGAPLFESVVNFQKEPFHAALRARGGTWAKRTFRIVRRPSIPLTLAVYGEPVLRARIGYDTRAFDVELVARMLRHLGVLLEGIAAGPARRVSELPMLTPAERRQVVEAWNATAAPLADTPVHVLVSGQAARTPDAVALAAGDERLAYAELDRRANRLAHFLRKRGVGPEARVGVCLERGPELAVSLLGVLKAGGAYVPLDPAYPAERIGYMLRDSGARILLTSGALAESFPVEGVATVAVDAEREALAAESAEPPPVETSPQSLAYVIYTSGSTGTPKGVAVTHGGVLNLVGWHRSAFGLTAADRTTLLAGVAFDASAWELWPTLTAGASLHVPAGEARLSPERLRDWLVEREVTVSFLPTPLAESVLTLEWPAETALRVLLTGGDALRVHPRPGLPFALVNAYGPTECTVVATSGVVPPREGPGHAPSIGGPVANTRAYVLDATREPVPVGVPGELYVGGAGVARGYPGRAALTAERFVPDPFAEERGARMYRTGDRVRWLASGELEFLGRVDRQVKIRGFRIEPGEVEAALLLHPSVRDAVVTVRDGAPGEPRLVAYVAAETAEAGAEALRAHLGGILPEYMVPSAFVLLDALPLTPNGKLDRGALPAPGEEAEEHVAPRTPVEEILAGIWSEVLGVERVGRDTHFFALGGHSLLATRMASRVRRAFGVDPALRTLFEHPTLAGLAARIATEQAAGAAPEVPPLRRVPREGVVPLSHAQERLWVVHRLEPESAAYNIRVLQRLRGPLDVEALRRALETVVERHESLRTTFPDGEGGPVQAVTPPAGFSLFAPELAGATEADSLRWARDFVEHPMELATGPLFRAALLPLPGDGHLLALAAHHAVFDGWSLEVLFRELEVLYRAFSRGEPSPLAPLPFQYADYAVWQRGWLRGDLVERQISYWRERLAGAAPLLELPTDRPRPLRAGGRRATRSFALPEGLGTELRALSRREGTTLFMTLLAAWQALLARYAGVEDVVVGTPVAGRDRVELEGLIGFFGNTLVLRTDLSGDPTARELLGRVRESVLGAHQNADVPFERVVDELGVERSLSHTPLFQVVFTLETARARLELGEVRAEPVAADDGTAKFDLILRMRDEGAGLSGELAYRTALFEAETVERMAEHLRALLEGMAAHPERRLSAVPLLGPAERSRVLGEWNATGRAYPVERCVHELVAEQARRTSGAVAVESADERLSYGELERRSAQLARHLAGLGVGPEVRVGVCLERSAWLVVGVLGVLRAGGAYVALDPGQPDERLRRVLADAGAAVVLTQESLAGRFGAHGGALVRLDADREAIERESAEPPPVQLTPENLAYVIYTSGSTGEPKGALVTHGGLANYLRWFDEAVLGAEGFALPLVSRLSFDAHVRQLFPPLLRGEAVWVLPEETVGDPVRLLEALGSRERVSFGGVPSLWSAVLDAVDAGERAAPRDLRAVLLGGEALSPELVRRTRGRFPGVRIWNHYGPTEATVNTTAACVAGPERVTLGAPIANVRVFVLDAHGAPAPVGVPGEAHVAGAGVARGYLGRPELTAERFVPDPFSGEGGARMYRSGDRVRWLAGGELEYLGRVDQQVKVRGFRIEPGEVEAALERHPAVREAVVLARGDASGERRLVAYVLPEGEVGAEALRGHLGGILPEYMVPSAFVLLDALPLTPNGKVDRRALPEPEQGSAKAYVAARTPTEEALAGAWAEVLGVERVGAHDNFFDLGGHSLRATQVVARVREALGVELPLRTLFEAQTVEALAARVDALLPEERKAPEQARERTSGEIRPRKADGPAPLSFAQQRLWAIHGMDPESPAYHLPLVLRLRGELEVEALRTALSALVERHESLRTVFPTVDDHPVQRVLPPGSTPLTVLDASGLAEALRRAEELAWAPMDLARGPLFRPTLLRIEEEDHLLVLAMHHVVSDGWSNGVLLRELGALYTALLRGEPAPLPAPALQYADYAVWQRERLSGPVLEREVRYWRERLAGAPALLELPTDRPRRAFHTARTGSHPVRIPPELGDGLRALAREEGATLFMAALAAFQLLLAKYAGAEEVVVGTPVAGRTHRALEGLVGFFVNALAIRTGFAGDPSFREVLGRVREGTLGAFAHQELPFEKLVEELQPERSGAHTPVFQVMFTLQNLPARDLRLPGVLFEAVELADPPAKFDLSLGLSEGADGMSGWLRYDAGLFDASTVERLAGHFLVLLRAVVGAPDARISMLSLLEEGERRELLGEWGAGAGVPAGALVHERFAAHAHRAPGAVALCFGEETLGYDELRRRANRIAHYLRSEGVGPEVRVGVCLEPGPEQVAAVLGVLAAGGAYLPLDPAHPPERTAHVLRDAGAGIVLTREAPAGSLGEHGARCVLLDRDAEEIAARSDRDPEVRVHPENTAYVIYTSGSTGTPKGVAVQHGGVASLVADTHADVGTGPGDVTASLASFTFDVWVYEVLVPLASGGAVRMIPREQVLDVPALMEEMAEVSILYGVPVLLRELAGAVLASPRRALPRVRAVVAGGDLVPAELLREMRRAFPSAWLRVAYGPTETTVACVTYRVGEEIPGRSVIGRPLANVTARVVDAAGEPLPVGVPGELRIGGAGVARGYLGRPGLTAERFVPDPFSGEGGARTYRTGDRVRWLADGTLEFLGRVDQQVKVRGFRIEPGEVQAALERHPAVREAVVVARPDGSGERRLVAYVVAEGEVGTEALRGHLGRILPAYMVPSAFVVLDSLPLTPSGKVDRRALPEPEQGSAEAYVAPRTALERVLAESWGEVLEVERVGAHDSFFALGGHSLRATQVVSRLRALKLEVPVRLFFETSTLEEMARELVAREASPGQTERLAALVLRLRSLSPEARQKLLWAKQGRAEVG